MTPSGALELELKSRQSVNVHDLSGYSFTPSAVTGTLRIENDTFRMLGENPLFMELLLGEKEYSEPCFGMQRINVELFTDLLLDRHPAVQLIQ